MVTYRKATIDDLERVWAYNMAMNPDEPRMQRWKESYVKRNLECRAATYVVIIDGEPVGEVTLDYFAEAYGNPEIRKYLADGSKTGYLTALRIRKEYEGKGYVSQLMRFVEKEAADMGFTTLTIGVDACENRNRAMYLHWGYNNFILDEQDGDEIVLFYAKYL